MSESRDHAALFPSRYDIFILALIAFLVRLAWVYFASWSGGDTYTYIDLARNIATHHSYSFSDSTGLRPTAAIPPLYPTLLALLWWGNSVPVQAMMLLQCVLAALTVVFTYLTARDQLNRSVALIAGLGIALGPLGCRYAATIMTEVLYTFFVILGVWLWGRKKPIWSGFVFGLGMVTRLTMGPFFVLLLLLTFLRPWRKERRDYVLIIVLAVAMCLPWIIRNAFVFHRFVPVASIGWGTNVLYGTVDVALVGSDNWTKALDEVLSLRAPKNETEFEMNKRYLYTGISRIRENPLRWLRVRAKQYPRLFMDSGDYLLGSNNVTFGTALREKNLPVIITKLSFMTGNLLLFLLATLGIWFNRRRIVALTPIVLFPIFLVLVHLPLWVGDSRYSLPMIPLVAILAASAIVHIAGSFRGTSVSGRSKN